MPDATERWIRKIRLGEDSFLELEEVVFAGGRIKGPGRDQLADELAALADAAGHLRGVRGGLRYGRRGVRRTERQVVPSAGVEDVDFGGVRVFQRHGTGADQQ